MLYWPERVVFKLVIAGQSGQTAGAGTQRKEDLSRRVQPDLHSNKHEWLTQQQQHAFKTNNVYAVLTSV